MSEPIRLSKRVIELTGCSRREAELFIEGGWVTVDGVVVDQPQFKVDQQAVALLPGAVAEPLMPVTLLLNQPADVRDGESLGEMIRPETHWADDPSGRPVLRGHFVRLTSSLALQPGAAGLAVFTQDWRTLRKLTADAAKIEQEYVVDVSGEISPGGLERLNKGATFKGTQLPRCKASWQNENRLRFALKNPSPGIIQTLCASVGLHVREMKRIRIGGVPMGKLPSGHWRYLSGVERF